MQYWVAVRLEEGEKGLRGRRDGGQKHVQGGETSMQKIIGFKEEFCPVCFEPLNTFDPPLECGHVRHKRSPINDDDGE